MNRDNNPASPPAGTTWVGDWDARFHDRVYGADPVAVGDIAALRWIGNLPISAPTLSNDCPWLLIPPGPNRSLPAQIDTELWTAKALVMHPSDSNIGVWVLQRR